MTFDPSANVRKESLICIGRLVVVDVNDEIKNNIRIVIERFTERFIEIASGDISDDVALEMFKLLRKLQVKGFLDHIGDELDLVDQIVFDVSANSRVRQECLAFVMDHTEGFEILDDAIDSTTDIVESSSSALKSTKRKSQKTKLSNINNPTENTAVKKRHAFQLETLAEFAEYHLLKSSDVWDTSDTLNNTDLLADACLALPNFSKSSVERLI